MHPFPQRTQLGPLCFFHGLLMALDISKLEVAVAEGKRWRRTLSITVPSMLVQAERKAAVKKLSSRLKLPGFRSGKIPTALVEKRFGPTLEQEVLDHVIGEAYRGALEEQSLRPISEGKVGEIDYQPESDLKFEISFDVAPQVELARIGGFKVERPAIQVTQEQVDGVLARIREQKGTWIPIETGSPDSGNLVSVQIERLNEEEDEPRPYEFVLGKDQAIPDVERSIRTLEVGGSGEFTICFPEDMADEERRGTEQSVKIVLDGRKQLKLPELDDAFAASSGKFKTLEELTDQIREDLTEVATGKADEALQGELIEQILSANPFDIPESMVDQYVLSALGHPEDLPDEQFAEAKEQLRPRAIHAVRRHIVIDRISEVQELVASGEEVDTRIEEIAEQTSGTLSEVYSRLQKSGQLDHLEREITEKKVFDFLQEQSEIMEPI